MEQRAFVKLVRGALSHVYDPAYLQRHTLASALCPGAGVGAAGEHLKRVLLEAIGSLRPSSEAPAYSAAWRTYQALCLQYIDGLDRTTAARKMGVGVRQFSREQLRGVLAVADHLWAEYPQLHASAAEPTLASSMLDAELRRLAAASPVSGTAFPEALQSTLSSLAPLARRRSILLVSPPAPDLPPVSVERVVLRQALLSTLSYLLDRGSKGAVEVSGRAVGRSLEISVLRRPAVAVPPLGPEDVQSDERLETASRLLATRGGRLEVDSRNGLSIRISLPIRPSATVLLVDDNAEVTRLFRRYLAGTPYDVVEASSGQEALRLAQEIRPLAITLDVMMPSQDGWEVLQMLKNQPETRHIPVIVCSVLREGSLASALGADEFLAKPVTRHQLVETLARCASGAAAAPHPD